jgi:hypothetical protein
LQFDSKIVVVIRSDLEAWQKRNVASIYTDDMFKTTHDAANREAVSAVIRSELNTGGIGDARLWWDGRCAANAR